MAVSVRTVPRRASISNILVATTIVAGVLAVLPIVGAIGASFFHHSAPRTAFASAPAGDYGVAARTEDDVDRIFVVPAGNPSGAMEVGAIRHLPGFAARASVSPDGKHLAAVIAEAGTPARPLASLVTLDLRSGLLTRLAVDIDLLQTPLWAPDGSAVVVSRTLPANDGAATVRLLSIDAQAKSPVVQVAEFDHALAAYAVGFSASGELTAVVIDARGSTVVRGATAVSISSHITRDWQLSPDGSAIAFIEADTTNGLAYRARTVSLDGTRATSVQAQSLTTAGQQLGVAWRPGSAAPTVGEEPSAQNSGVTAQTSELRTQNSLTASGFDVPLAYSKNGDFLAVQRWSGADFENAGVPQLQFVTPDGRMPLTGFTRFFGWASR